jgi:hypothetical protein
MTGARILCRDGLSRRAGSVAVRSELPQHRRRGRDHDLRRTCWSDDSHSRIRRHPVVTAISAASTAKSQPVDG